MKLRRKLYTLFLVLSLALLAGASVVGPKLRPDRRPTARLYKERAQHVAAARQSQSSVSGIESGSAVIQDYTQRAPAPVEERARVRRTKVSIRQPAQPSTSHPSPLAKSASKQGELAVSIQSLAESKEPYSKHKEPGPTDPGGALRFRHLQMQDENGEIPQDGMEKARQHVKMMKAEKLKRVKAQSQLNAQSQTEAEPQVGILAAGVEPDSWTWLGPGNVGGRIRSIIIHPTAPDNMWVGSVTGGIWRTTNAGVSWFPVNDFQANLAVSTMVINPAFPGTMYAGTGEGLWPVISQNSYIDAVQGAGVYQSVDGGLTWNLLANTNPAAAALPGCGLGTTPCPAFWFFVNRLAISPDGNTLLAATNGGIAQSTNAGTTWIQRTANRAADIEFRPDNSSRAMIGELGAARFSLNSGQTWTAATFNPAVTSGGRVELATSPGNASIVYASVNQNSGEIYRSNDGGQSYTRVNTGNNFLGTQGDYDNALWLNPQDPDTVIVGGIHLWRGRYSQPNLPLTQISDGSLNGDGTPRSAHADHHIIVSHPGFNNNTNRAAYFGNDGGLYRADAAAVTLTTGWTELNNNLGITQFYGAAGNPATGVIVGGTQDNGTLRFANNTEGWTSTFGNDGGYCASDPTDANFFYGESQNLAVHRSTNGGMSAANIFAGITDANNGATTNFIAPLVLDTVDPNTLLAGGISLWRSQNVKDTTPTWRRIKNPIAGNIPISAIAISPNTSSLVLVGHNDGSIFRTLGGTLADPTGTWTQIDTAVLPNRMVTRLVIDTSRGVNWFYATFGGFAGDSIWRSTDNGASWADITGNGVTGLPAVPVRTLAFHPVNSNLLYVGTEIGIFTSEDAGANWEPTQDGPANVSVDELFWMGGDLIAATHGRGLYRASGGVYVNCSYNGPEDGSIGRPFNTVTEAVNATNRYRAVWIFAGTCSEPFTLPIDKRLELRSLGGAATLRRP